MKNLAILDYTFIFEPSVETWQRGFDFERDLADYFSAHEFKADIVDVTGGSTRRVIYVSKIEKMDTPKPEEVKQNPPSVAISNLQRNLRVAKLSK